MNIFLRIFQFAVVVLFSPLISGEDCVWNKDTDYPEFPPLLINKDTWISLKAVNENGERVVRIAENTVVVIACSGTLIETLQEEVVEGFCEGGQNLNIDGSTYTINDLGCSSVVENSISPTLNPCGADDQGVTTLIGFDVPGYSFYPTINVCFQTDAETNMYSEHVVYGENVDAGDGNPEKPYFYDDVQFYPIIDPNECYLTAHQDEYFTSFTGDPDFIDLDTSIYFARGHMAPNADFLTDMEADASYHYLNAVPQWQLYNGGNWMYMESDVRDLAESHRSNLHIFTGPWQNLVLNDVNNNPTTIYICNSQDQTVIPVPRLVWKVIYEPTTNRGLAVVTSNYPHEEEPQDPICNDLGCDTISWLSFDPSSLSKGFTYCCTVQDLRSAVPNAPDYPDADILYD